MHIFFLLMAFVLICADSLAKYFAYVYLKPVSSIQLPIRFLNLTYVENRGAAFGILQNQKFFFFLVTALALIVTLYYFFSLPYSKLNNIIKFCLVLIFSGTIGNFLDRIFRGYVVDFLEFTFIDFPVFNLADVYLTVGCVLISIILLKAKN